MLTWIFAAVLGSRNDLTVFHKSLNPEPALMMNIRCNVCKNIVYHPIQVFYYSNWNPFRPQNMDVGHKPLGSCHCQFSAIVQSALGQSC